MSEIYISVDIETSGPIVARHSLLSIGACVCDDTLKTFTRELQPISDAQDSDAMKIVGKPLEHYATNGATSEQVFTDFEAWILQVSGDSTPVFVGFNAGFDWAFINWYFLTYGDSNPFGFAPFDIKALYAGFSGCDWDETSSKRLPEEFQSGTEHTHDPLDDAIGQAIAFMKIRSASLARRDEPAADNNLVTDALRERLKNLCRKADQQSSMHAVLRDRYNVATFVLSLSTLIPTALLLCLVLVSDDYAQKVFGLNPYDFKLLNAGVALFSFICILLQLLWKPDSRAAEHTRAVEHYSQVNYEASRQIETGTAPSIEPVRLIEEKYLDRRGLPPIPENDFNRLKRRHLRKVALSKNISKDPWTKLPRFGARTKT